MNIEKVMDRQKIADTIHGALEVGLEMFQKENLEQQDFAKLKALRGLASYVNAATTMVQQETAQQRAIIVLERMKQLGYETPKSLA
jgi:hypothetical protein